MLTVYAEPDDLAEWTGTAAPVNAVPLLRSATFLVAFACFRNPFADTPSESEAEVLNAATCAQAAAWAAAGIDPTTLGLSAPLVKKSSILGADVENDTSTMFAARQAAIEKLAPEAVAILTAAGLIYEPVPVGADPSDPLPQWGQGRSWWPYPEPLSGEYEWPLDFGLGGGPTLPDSVIIDGGTP